MKLTVDMGIKISEVNEQEYNAFIDLAKECGCRLYFNRDADYNTTIATSNSPYIFIDEDLDILIGRGTYTTSGKVNDVTKEFKQYYEEKNMTQTFTETNLPFSKQDLMTGDVVECRNGETFRVILGGVDDVMVNYHTYNFVNEYNDKLTVSGNVQNEWDIIKVYRPTEPHMLKGNYAEEPELYKLDLVFDRNAKTKEQAEIERLQGIIKNAQKELDKMQLDKLSC